MAFTTFQWRRDTAANWTSADPVLASGEPGLETDTGKCKVGDGSTKWSSLAYFSPDGSSGGGGSDGVSSFNTRTGDVSLAKTDVTSTGLSYADVGADASGAASAAQANAESYTDTKVAAVQADIPATYVETFNTRAGTVTLSKADITGTGLTYSDVGADPAGSAGGALPRTGGTLSGAITPAVVQLTSGATIPVNAAAGNDFRLTLATAGMLADPAGPVDGQKIIVQVTQGGSGGYTLTYGDAYEFSAALPAPVLSTTAGATDLLGFIYNAAKGKWLFTAFLAGF